MKEGEREREERRPQMAHRRGSRTTRSLRLSPDGPHHSSASLDSNESHLPPERDDRRVKIPRVGLRCTPEG